MVRRGSPVRVRKRAKRKGPGKGAFSAEELGPWGAIPIFAAGTGLRPQYSGGDLSACKAIRVKKVTCHWSGNDVYVTVVFNNTFGAHVTVHFQPIYVLKNAGLHGNGLTSSQDVGLDPGERREYAAKQEPKGVSGRPKITKCAPKFDDILGVELG